MYSYYSLLNKMFNNLRLYKINSMFNSLYLNKSLSFSTVDFNNSIKIIPRNFRKVFNKNYFSKIVKNFCVSFKSKVHKKTLIFQKNFF